jgi:PAS domain S-box-containing protein
MTSVIPEIKVLFIGYDENTEHIINELSEFKNQINIIGVIMLGNHDVAEFKNGDIDFFDYDYIHEIMKDYKSIDVLVLNEETDCNHEDIKKLESLNAAVFHKSSLNLLKLLLNTNRNLKMDADKSENLKIELNAILDATGEAIQVVDKDGIIKYVNKAFTDVTKIPAEKRINYNILDFYDQGAIADALKTQKPVFGKVLTTETNVVVICNATPIFVKGEFNGAVCVFRDITDVTRMSEKLVNNEKYIKKLKNELRNMNSAKYTFNNIIGESKTITECINLAKKVSNSSTTTLVTGESGTGKELFAQAIHNYGPRSLQPFISINCAAIPDQLLESELFGYEKGAFTGANTAKKGKFEVANGGTIFLDEIGDMNIDLQAKLLRVLQEKEIEPIGSSQKIAIDVHIISATHTNLINKINLGTFRKDLFYRLSIIQIHIPPLRERIEDIKLISQNFLNLKNSQLNKNCDFTNESLDKLMSYDWPGNVRELANVIERAVLISETDHIEPSFIFLNPLNMQIIEKNNSFVNLEKNEKILIEKALNLYGYDLKGKKKAAKELNISLSTLYNKINIHKIKSKNQ